MSEEHESVLLTDSPEELLVVLLHVHLPRPIESHLDHGGTCHSKMADAGERSSARKVERPPGLAVVLIEVRGDPAAPPNH